GAVERNRTLRIARARLPRPKAPSAEPARGPAEQPDDIQDYFGHSQYEVDAATDAEELRRLLGEEA
ncbi:MAG: hypothetical protein NTZ05_09260, partial [Chloroflexi bacterium]|nr:hypothetical protein [Chloroflexota bacterium]